MKVRGSSMSDLTLLMPLHDSQEICPSLRPDTRSQRCFQSFLFSFSPVLDSNTIKDFYKSNMAF